MVASGPLCIVTLREVARVGTRGQFGASSTPEHFNNLFPYYADVDSRTVRKYTRLPSIQWPLLCSRDCGVDPPVSLSHTVFKIFVDIHTAQIHKGRHSLHTPQMANAWSRQAPTVQFESIPQVLTASPRILTTVRTITLLLWRQCVALSP